MIACGACVGRSSCKSCLGPQSCKQARMTQRQHHGIAQRSLLLPEASDGAKSCRALRLRLRQLLCIALGAICLQLQCAAASALHRVLLRLPRCRRQLIPAIAPPVQAGVTAFRPRRTLPTCTQSLNTMPHARKHEHYAQNTTPDRQVLACGLPAGAWRSVRLAIRRRPAAPRPSAACRSARPT